MKKLIAGIALFGTFALASAQTITFDKTTFDYGNVKPSSDGIRFFTVTNTGDKPLILSNVKASCGCTTPEFSQDPIMPVSYTHLDVYKRQLLISYNSCEINIFKRNFFSVFQPCHNHSCYPEENNIRTCNQI